MIHAWAQLWWFSTMHVHPLVVIWITTPARPGLNETNKTHIHILVNLFQIMTLWLYYFFKIKCSIHSHYFIYKIFFPLKRWVGGGGSEGAGPLCTPINHINQLRRRSGTQDSHGACETKWACVGRYVTLGGGRVEPNLTTVLTVADLGLFRRRSQRNSRSRLLSSASSRRFS